MDRKTEIELNDLRLRFAYASRNFIEFAELVEPDLEMTQFHHTYYKLLNEFALGKIRRMIVSVPPQHGKSLGSSKLLPAFMLGVNPDLKITIASYSFALARKFGQGVQQLIISKEYQKLFKETRIKEKGSGDSTAIRTADEFDCLGRSGGLRLVGRESSLTGNRVDVMIMDDLYKDAMEANSPIIRENVWDWYTSVVRTRMHNHSSELIVFTRWHEDDLIGRIGKNELIYDLTSFEQLSDIPPRAWIRINFEAIKEGRSTEIDPRDPGEALWKERHNVELLIERRSLDSQVFDALYQGRPSNREGLLYGTFKTYNKIESPIIKRGNYTDTADTGNDYLCSVCYNTCEDGNIYITDLIYTRKSMEITEPMVAKMLIDNKTEASVIESNNGGRGFSRAVSKLIDKKEKIKIFTQLQRKNKESRILSYATAVNRNIIMPNDWNLKWKIFADHLQNFQQVFHANAHDDAPDTLTAIIELETTTNNKIESVSFTSNHF